MCGMVHSSLPPFVPVEQPAVHSISCLWLSFGRHVCRIRSVTGLCQAEGHSEFALQTQRYELLLLLLTAKVHEHDDIGKVPDH